MSRKNKKEQRFGRSARGSYALASKPRLGGVDAGVDGESKRPILRFVALFFLYMALLYGCQITPAFMKIILPWHLELNAEIAGAILQMFHHGVSSDGQSVWSPAFSIKVVRGCDVVQPSIIFVSAVLASPVPNLSKIPGVLAGTFLLMLANIVRIVSLFLAGVYLPRVFSFAHGEGWPTVFIFMALMLWLIWVRWARRRMILVDDVVT